MHRRVTVVVLLHLIFNGIHVATCTCIMCTNICGMYVHVYTSYIYWILVAVSSPSVPLGVEAVMELLRPVTEKWRKIAEEGLGMDEDEVDEIFTNNELAVECLRDCVERLVERGLTWEKLGSALRAVGEEGLAEKAMKKG